MSINFNYKNDSAFYPWSAVLILPSVCILPPVCSLQSAVFVLHWPVKKHNIAQNAIVFRDMYLQCPLNQRAA